MERTPRSIRRRPARSDNPARLGISRETRAVLCTIEFRCWYETERCDGAPSFPHFLAYVDHSMVYDLPGRELSSLIWESAARAFRSFDAARGDPGTAVEARFLRHWRSHFANVVKQSTRRGRAFEVLLADPIGPGHDPIDEMMLRNVRELVEALPEEEGLIIRRRYFEGESFEAIARLLRRRKKFVLDRHAEILARFRVALEGAATDRRE